jgi:hypothetical protein
MSKEQAKIIRTWIQPKEVIIHTLNQKIETVELQIKHNLENISNGHFIKEQMKIIVEQESEYNKKLQEFELEKLESDIKNGFLTRQSEMALAELKAQLETEELQLVEIRKSVVMAERNHDVKEVAGKELKPSEKKKDE